MIPIHELLNKIRWDKEFGKGSFTIGYYDRVEGEIIRVPFAQMHFDPGDHFSFQVLDQEGEIHTVPFHRVKEVFKDGELVWHREH